MGKKGLLFFSILLFFFCSNGISAENYNKTISESTYQTQTEEPWILVEKMQFQKNKSETITTEKLACGWQELSDDYAHKEQTDVIRLIRSMFQIMVETEKSEKHWFVTFAEKLTATKSKEKQIAHINYGKIKEILEKNKFKEKITKTINLDDFTEGITKQEEGDFATEIISVIHECIKTEKAQLQHNQYHLEYDLRLETNAIGHIMNTVFIAMKEQFERKKN